jgi:predicted DNA-binding protein
MDDFLLDPDRLPKKLDVDLPPELAERLMKVSAVSGRSVDELILEILDKFLGDY